MNIRPEEISSVIQKEISEYKVELDIEEVGTVIHIGDGVARVYGLKNCVYFRAHRVPLDGVFGMALNLEFEEDNVGCILFGSDTLVREGDQRLRRTGRVMSVPVGEAVLGRVVNPLGAARSMARVTLRVMRRSLSISRHRALLNVNR